ETRPLLVARVVQLAHRPRGVGARLEAHAGVRVAQAEAAEVRAGARDEGYRLARLVELVFDEGGEAQQPVLLLGAHRCRTIAKPQLSRCRMRPLRAAPDDGGEQQEAQLQSLT